MKSKKNFKKPALPRESLLEVARHAGYYEQVNTCYKATFHFAYLAQAMLFIANLYFSASVFGFFGICTSIGSVFYSHLAQKDFYNENKKRGTVLQFVAIGFGCLSFILLSLSYFYQFNF